MIYIAVTPKEYEYILQRAKKDKKYRLLKRINVKS